MNDAEYKIVELALKEYGFNKQAIKCIEELSELQKALCKWLLGQGDVGQIEEEIADVEIMIESMKIGLDIGPGDLDEFKRRKINRLKASLWKLGSMVEPINETMCKICSYHMITNEELQALGGEDPCETCDDLSNWKQKEYQCPHGYSNSDDCPDCRH
jgi:hypothetical protein